MQVTVRIEPGQEISGYGGCGGISVSIDGVEQRVNRPGSPEAYNSVPKAAVMPEETAEKAEEERKTKAAAGEEKKEEKKEEEMDYAEKDVKS